MPVKDPEKRKQIAREWYHRNKNKLSNKNKSRNARYQNDSEYRERVKTQARERKRTLAQDPTWRNKRNTSRKDHANAHPELYLLKSAKARAKKTGCDFCLEPRDIIIPSNCPILGIPLFKGLGRACDNSPNVDRIDNNKGYTPDNIWVISSRANRIKNNASWQELILIGEKVKEKINEQNQLRRFV